MGYGEVSKLPDAKELRKAYTHGPYKYEGHKRIKDGPARWHIFVLLRVSKPNATPYYTMVVHKYEKDGPALLEKIMDESVCPYMFDVPESLFKYLSLKAPEELGQGAQLWREAVRIYHNTYDESAAHLHIRKGGVYSV